MQDTAQIIDVIKTEDGKTCIILDQTIFYPQGGGQPFDQGTIKNEIALFNVNEVRFKDGIVYHFGNFESGSLNPGKSVTLMVDKPRRLLNSRNHSAGHLVDLALYNLNKFMNPAKGYHFPEGAYVEYEGTLEEQERNELIKPLQAEINKIVHASLPIEIQLVTKKQLEDKSKFIPDDLPTNKPTRIMTVQGYMAIPCGGTHVTNTKDIGLTINKIRNKKGNLRISYSVN